MVPVTDTSVILVANAGLAQLVAQLTCNQWVSGSSPEAGTIFARMSELVDEMDLKSIDYKQSCKFKSCCEHHLLRS